MRPNIEDMLAKVRGYSAPLNSTIVHSPSYSSEDIQAAKAVLTRLLVSSSQNQVSYISSAPIELAE